MDGHPRWGVLTDSQIQAARILAGRRHMPVTEGKTTEKAINRTTAWSLEQANLANCYFHHRHGERVQPNPMLKQLLEMRA